MNAKSGKEHPKPNAEKANLDFAAVVSHELRTPLTSIKASLSLVSEYLAEENPPEVKYFIDVCCRNADRTIRLLDGVLGMAKAHAGVAEMSLSTFDLCQVARDAVDDMQGLARQNKVDLQCLRSQPLRICADRQKVEQILFNLLSNGVKFGKGAWVKVHITRDREAARIEVSDGGPGIAAENFKAIFEEFTQAGTHPAPDIAGVGLGLSIVRAFVEEHRGQVWVESEEGRGSRFIVELPLEASH